MQKIKIFAVYLLISGGVAVSVVLMILELLTAVFVTQVYLPLQAQ
jgi:hypothetical protein